MVRKDTGLKMLLAIVVAASIFLAGVLATWNTASAGNFGGEWITQNLAITSEPENGDTYRIDEVIDVTLTYSVTMDMPEQSAIGIAVGNNLRRASIDKERWMLGLFPEGGPITFHGEEFVFSYTVQADDFDSDGVSISETVFDFTIALRPTQTPTSQAQPRLRTPTSQTQSRMTVISVMLYPATPVSLSNQGTRWMADRG